MKLAELVMTNEERTTKLLLLSDYIEAGQHRTGLKSFKQIAREIGVSEPTARRWITEGFPEIAKDIRKLTERTHAPKIRYEDEEPLPAGWEYVD